MKRTLLSLLLLAGCRAPAPDYTMTITVNGATVARVSPDDEDFFIGAAQLAADRFRGTAVVTQQGRVICELPPHK